MFTKFPRDLYIPLDLDLPLEDLDLFLSQECPLANNGFVLCPSIFFCIISSNKKYETTSSKFKEIVLIPMAKPRISHDSGKDQSKLIHLSSSEILISTYTN
jgi:hypothetical protein